MKAFLRKLKEVLFVKKEKQHSDKYYKRIDFLNKHSLFFHVASLQH